MIKHGRCRDCAYSLPFGIVKSKFGLKKSGSLSRRGCTKGYDKPDLACDHFCMDPVYTYGNNCRTCRLHHTECSGWIIGLSKVNLGGCWERRKE